MSEAFRIRGILEETQRLTGTSMARLKGQDRSAESSRARWAAMWVVREHYGFSLAEIGRQFGDRDHTTVRHACCRARELRERDASFKWLCDQLEDVTRQPSLAFAREAS